MITHIQNWNELISLCYSHGVFPIVYKVLKEYESLIPSEIFSKMKIQNLNLAKQNMMMTSELIKVMKFLEENDIQAFTFKGPTLSQMAYGDILSRQYVDLDIYIDVSNVYKLKSLLENTNNYKRSLTITPSQEEKWFRHSHDLGMTNIKNKVHIEFHWTMLDSDHPIRLENIDFLKSISKMELKNSTVNTLDNNELLIYLCVHGSKHLFERVEWVVDLDKFIRNQKINWDYIYKFIQKDNSAKFILLGLFLTEKLFNTPIDSRISKLFDRSLNEIFEHIFLIWNQEKDGNIKNNIKYMLKLFLSKKEQFLYLNKVYLKPTFSEYWYINFPKPLYFLYYPLRQYLLVKKYFFK